MLSVLVPYREEANRGLVWTWLERYYRQVLPEAEIVMGSDEGVPFSKTTAVNDAASKASGDTYLILDADGLIPAAQIIEAMDAEHWAMPYSRCMRLPQKFSAGVLDQEPETFNPNLIRADEYEHVNVAKLGGLAMVLSREAFEEVEGFDERFRGWGYEDACMGYMLDTLIGRRTFVKGRAYHLWHPRPGESRSREWLTRRWEGQTEKRNEELRSMYVKSRWNPVMMRKCKNPKQPNVSAKVA